MSEVEIMEEFAIRGDRIWSVLQWWASVTFAVLLAAHVGASSLNRVVVTIMLGIYSMFTVLIAQIILANFLAGAAVAAALRKVAETTTLSPIGQNVLDDDPTIRATTMVLVMVITFSATIFYAIYSYRKGRDI